MPIFRNWKYLINILGIRFRLLIIFIGSVSDLLDYINPSPDDSGRDTAGVKRKNYLTKVNLILAYLNILSLHRK